MAAAVLLSLTLALAGGGAAERFVGRTVSQVELTAGPGPVPAEARGLVEVRPGDPYSPTAVRRSIQQLFALGVFSDIKVEALPEGENVSLTFHLFPALKVAQVGLAGLEQKEEASKLRGALLQEIQIAPGDPLDVERLAQAADRISARLRQSGFLWARAEPEVRFEGQTAFLAFHIDPGPRARVSTLVVRGDPPHLQQHLRRSINLAAGQFYNRRELDERIGRVVEGWKDRGFYEARVEIREAAEPPDRVRLELELALGPRVRIQVEGARLSKKLLARLVPLAEEVSVSEDLIEESRANLEEHFRESGYAQVRVETEKVLEPGGRLLNLRFLVEPGPRIQVAEVRLAGLASFSSPEVLSLLATRPKGPLRPAYFRPRAWEQDLGEVRRLLNRHGFHRAVVRGEVRERPGSPGQVELVVRVEEGPRARLESIEVDGARQIAAEEVVARSGLSPGAVFDASQVVGARERIANFYRDQGFAEAAVEAATELDGSGTRARVSFLIEEGEQTRVDRIIISGLATTREELVRRQVAVSPGAPLSAQGLAETRQNLAGMGLFRDVRLEVLPVDESTRSSDVLITLQEGPRTSVGYGFGYEERQLARAEAEITRRNLLGLNRSASFFARGSFRGNRFIATYRQPDTFGLDLPVFVTVFREEEDREGFDFIRLGAGIQFSKKLAAHRTLFFRYNFQRTRLFNLELDRRELRFSNTRLSTVSVSWVKDTRDDPLNPSRGSFATVDVQYSPKLLGSRVRFVKLLAQQFLYYPLPHRMTAALGFRLGLAQTFREDRDALIPITERFFAGGASTLRGFGLDEASPKTPPTLDNPRGIPIGGNVLSLVNLELRFPLLRSLGGVLFSDNGTVYRRLSVIELLNWRYNLGFGLRYQTPLGPLRIDYGVKLDRRVDPVCLELGLAPEKCRESRGNFHVSLGHAF